eukprot:2519158-Amphidinium_carterae.1
MFVLGLGGSRWVCCSVGPAVGYKSWNQQESLDCLIPQAVPGFLEVSGFWQWVVNNTVTLVSAAATSFGLDFLAAKLSGPKVDSRWLQLLGVLLASIVLPGLARKNIAEHAPLCLKSLWSEQPIEQSSRCFPLSGFPGQIITYLLFCDALENPD